MDQTCQYYLMLRKKILVPEQITYLLQMLKVFQIPADSKPSIFHIMFSYPSEKGQQ